VKQDTLTVLDYYSLNETCLRQLAKIATFYGIHLSETDLLQAYRSLSIHSLKDLAINGNDLMQALNRKGGAWLKETLQYCERQVLKNKVPNERMSLLDAALEFVNSSDKASD